MKRAFKEYHSYDASATEELWSTGTIILDTNVLLDFYAFGETTLADYLKVLRSIKKREQLWMPNRVGYEFFENRMGIINKQLNQYDNVLKSLESPKDKIAKLAETSATHAHLDFNKISSDYEASVKTLKEEIEKLRDQHPDHVSTDKVLAELEKIYVDTLVGSEYDDTRTEKVIKLGEERYAKKIPPGFKDQDKDDGEKPYANRKYGDLIIWMQMIDYAKETKKPIIFVTNDAKDDWVQYAKERRRIGPKPALKKEMLSEADVDFELYSSDEFLKHASKYLKLALNRDSVNEVKKHRRLELRQSDNFVGPPNDYVSAIHNALLDGPSMQTHLANYLDYTSSTLYRHIERGLKLIRYIEDEIEKQNLVAYRSMEELRRLYNIYQDMRVLIKRRHIPLNAARFERYISEANEGLRLLYLEGVSEAEELVTVNKRILHILADDARSQ
jgi:hypothetical protein